MVKNRIKELRVRNKLTVQELADQVGIQPPSVSFQENMKRNLTIENAIKYADFFGVSLDFLFYRDSQDSVMGKYKTEELEEFLQYISQELQRRNK